MKVAFKSTYKWSLTCKEVTFLSSIREEQGLPFWLEMRIRYHLGLCGPCRRFIHQSKLIASRMSQRFQQLSETFKLSDDDKKALKERLKNEKK